MIATSRRMRAATFALFLTVAAAGCVTTPVDWMAEPWPAADDLFRSDPRWRGADAAFSVPIDGDRILWLFGDTFIGDGTARRNESAFIRNSIAVQTGHDVLEGRISFHWGGRPGAPDSFFPSTADAWLWPVHGIERNGVLTLFFMRVIGADSGLGFAHAGAAALRVHDISGPPETWAIESLALPGDIAPQSLIYGVALVEQRDFVYAYCAAEEGGHNTYLLRWRVEEFDAGRLTQPQWWDGETFVRDPGRRPAVVLRDAATEFSVHRLADGRYAQIQSVGFGHSSVAIRVAPRPEGPWSAPRPVYRPPESGRKGTFVYAAKAHPELSRREIIVTYAANHFDSAVLLQDESLYYPRFVRIRPAR